MVNSQQSRRLFTVVSAYRRALIEDRPTTQPAPLGRIVIEREAAIIEAADQRGPARSHVAEGGGKFRICATACAGSRWPRRPSPRRSASIAPDVLVAGIGQENLNALLDGIELADAVERLLGDRARERRSRRPPPIANPDPISVVGDEADDGSQKPANCVPGIP